MTYTFASNTIGAIDVTTTTTIAPGVSNLPSTVLEAQLGEIRTAWDPTYGYGEFIYLKIPASTAITANLVYQWTAGYAVAALPVLATSKNTGHQVAVAPAAVASSTSVQYGWFQIQGQTPVLKTAVTVSPDSVVYASGTAGRIKVLTSAGGQITGMRTANAATVTSTTSTVLCYLNRPAMQGQIT
ncbi:MAG: hypothetical protein EBR82_23035 [Caulobacteraceae bacterium]|nr:hypothetical protein [Caulobacteraceae bacterium]NDC25727.1 hypothetical protein [Pseudomonadota bacterium]NDD05527.1 hypothetical protein [Pseudomonadota bacterium]